MPITYDAGTNIVTVTGYTEAVPCNFTDIYNADVSGSWGVVTRQCTNQFCFNAKLQIGDGTTATHFMDKDVQVSFVASITTAHNQTVFSIKNNAYLTLGHLISGSQTDNSCTFILKSAYANIGFPTAEAGSEIKLYSTTWNFISTVGNNSWNSCIMIHTTSATIINCIINRVQIRSTVSGSVYLRNITITNVYNIFSGIGGDWECITVSGGKWGFYITNSAPNSIKDMNISNFSSSSMRTYQLTTHDVNCINFNIDTWNPSWAGTSSKEVYRQYEFDLEMVDSTGIGVATTKTKIWDKDDSIVTNATTNASGVLATQTLNYGYYHQTGGIMPVMKTPHEMRIYKYGKKMLSSKSSIEAKTNWALTMYADDHITQTAETTVAAYTGITINHTTETITISEDHTLDEIYDYCQYDMIAATKQIDQTMHTADGVNFVSEYSFVVNTGITVTATDQKLSMVSGETYTLTGTAQFTGIIATTTTTRIPIKLINVVDGSRYWVGATSGMVKIFDGTQSGSGVVTGYYEHTADTPVTVRVRKGSSSPKYLNYESFGTLYAAAAIFTISQVADSIA